MRIVLPNATVTRLLPPSSTAARMSPPSSAILLQRCWIISHPIVTYYTKRFRGISPESQTKILNSSLRTALTLPSRHLIRDDRTLELGSPKTCTGRHLSSVGDTRAWSSQGSILPLSQRWESPMAGQPIRGSSVGRLRSCCRISVRDKGWLFSYGSARSDRTSVSRRNWESHSLLPDRTSARGSVICGSWQRPVITGQPLLGKGKSCGGSGHFGISLLGI